MDQCPLPTEYKAINMNNHLVAIKMANLGPADPRQPSNDFWAAKMKLWKDKEGMARSKLCMNCENYDSSPETLVCIKNGDGSFKASALPLIPKWADIDGMPSAVCTLYSITCSSIRTCDSWEAPADNTLGIKSDLSSDNS